MTNASFLNRKPAGHSGTLRTRSLLCALGAFVLVSGGGAVAAEPDAAGADKEVTGMSDAEMASLDRFLSLSDEELDRMEQAIARIRRMSPAERAAFREKILSYRRLPDSERTAIRQSWGGSSPEERDLWREMMHALPVAERNALREKMQSLAPGERADFRNRVLTEWQQREAADAPSE